MRVARLVAFAAGLALAHPALAGDWKRAETHNFTIYSDGRSGQLEDFAREVEKFDALLRLLFKVPQVEEPNKLTIYMLSDAKEVEDLLGPGRKGIAGYYSARTSGSYAVANRQSGSRDDDLSGQRVLFHEYAHHFMFRNFTIPAPAWFVEGFAEFVATAEFDKNGSWTFGKPAKHRAAEIEYAPQIPIEALLTQRPGDSERNEAFYGWAWALTHMLYSEERERGRQIDAYLGAINRGQDPLEAARIAFGDLKQLERDMRLYTKRAMNYSRSPKPIAYRDEFTIAELGEIDSQVVELTLERLAGANFETTRDSLRELVATPGAGAEAWYQLAAAENAVVKREDDPPQAAFAPVETAVDRALALDRGHVRANVLKGDLLLAAYDQADDPDEALLAQAREHFLRANRTEPRNPLPLYAFARSYQERGEPHVQVAPALAAAFEAAPESRELRMAHAFDLANGGDFARAISLLQILANDPHGGEGGRAAIEAIEKMRDGRTGIGNGPVLDDDNGESADSG